MKNFIEGMVVAQEGEKIKNIEAVNARIKAANKEAGVVEIDEEMLEKLDLMDIPELEALAIVIAEKIADKKGSAN